MDFAGKRVVIMGLGLHGGGLAAAKFFFRHGARVFISDMKSAEELAPSLAQLRSYCSEYRIAHPEKQLSSVEYGLGGHQANHFEGADIVLQNPGVPRESPFLSVATECGAAIENEASIFFEVTRGAKKVAVTGTRGKSTTTMLIYEMLRRFYPRVFVAGVATAAGARGLLDIADEVCAAVSVRCDENDEVWAVVELSSWQLELFGAHAAHPDIAVITTVLQDHMNRYPDFQSYVDAKANICRFQSEGEYTVLNYDNYYTREIGHHGAHGTVEWFSQSGTHFGNGFLLDGETIVRLMEGKKTPIAKVSRKRVPGHHNDANILAATAASTLAGVNGETIQTAIDSFPGVPGRLEFLCEIEGRRIYNDTAATSPDATCAAVMALAEKAGGIVLIAGGADKNFTFGELADCLVRTVRSIVLLSGTATPGIASALTAAGYGGSLDLANSMHEAVARAWSRTSEGDILLLSPGVASFGMFLHEFDRGEQFRKEIELLADKHQGSAA